MFSLSNLIDISQLPRYESEITSEKRDSLLRTKKKLNQYNLDSNNSGIDVGIVLFPTLSMSYQSSERVDVLTSVVIFHALSFILDDLFDSLEYSDPTIQYFFTNIDEIVTNLIEGNILPKNSMPEKYYNIFQAYLNNRNQLKKFRNNSIWLKRFYNEFGTTLKSISYLNRYWHKLSFEAYLEYRINTCGALNSILFIEFYYKLELPKNIIKSNWYKKIIKYASLFIGLTNDLFSYSKDRDEKDSNGILLLEQNYTFEQSILEITTLINQVLDEFKNLKHQLINNRVQEEILLSDREFEMISQYLEHISYLLTALWHWQLSSERYKHSSSPFRELKV